MSFILNFRTTIFEFGDENRGLILLLNYLKISAQTLLKRDFRQLGYQFNSWHGAYRLLLFFYLRNSALFVYNGGLSEKAFYGLGIIQSKKVVERIVYTGVSTLEKDRKVDLRMGF